jgi:hypothetical protein
MSLVTSCSCSSDKLAHDGATRDLQQELRLAGRFSTAIGLQYRYLRRPNAWPFLARMRKTTPIARMIRPIVQKTMLIFGNNSETSKRTPKTITSFLPYDAFYTRK